jgi:predicted DNA repair protein MutK
MPGTLLALLDDITTLLDDVSVMTKVAATKTAGVLGDDLALNAQQVSGVDPDRELPVVWAVAKGSLLNKAILVPTALAISALAPWAITPLLMVGGSYLCFEGFEKVAHKLVYPRGGDPPDAHDAVPEKDKIKGAVRTDFILSAEIITIALGTIAQAPLLTQVAVLVSVAVLMTVFVYGLVGGIVKLDDLGLFLTRRQAAAARTAGRAILAGAPWLMRLLSVVGTAAMFLVGGNIVAHGIAPLHHVIEGLAAQAGAAGPVVAALLGGGLGLVIGAVLVGLVMLPRAWRKQRAQQA